MEYIKDATYIKNISMKIASVIKKRISHNELCEELMDIKLHETIVYNTLSNYALYYRDDYREMPINDFIGKHKDGIFLSMIKMYISYTEILKEEIELIKDSKPHQIIVKTEEPLDEVVEKIKNNKPIKIK